MSLFQKVEEFFEHLEPQEDHCEATVKKGDTLWGIAEQVTGDGSRWEEIAALNPGLNKAYTLQIGEKLKLPSSWTKEDE